MIKDAPHRDAICRKRTFSGVSPRCDACPFFGLESETACRVVTHHYPSVRRSDPAPVDGLTLPILYHACNKKYLGGNRAYTERCSAMVSVRGLFDEYNNCSPRMCFNSYVSIARRVCYTKGSCVLSYVIFIFQIHFRARWGTEPYVALHFVRILFLSSYLSLSPLPNITPLRPFGRV